jgi:maltose phosphorylase
MSKKADRYLEVDPWSIIEKGFHSDRSRVSESLFSVANEHMGVRGYFEEGYSGDRHQGSYINGVYESRKIWASYKGISTSGNYMLNTLDWLYTRIIVGGETLDLNQSKFSDFTRVLNMKTGTMSRGFVWQTQKGTKIRLTFTRFTSMALGQLGCQRLVVEPLDYAGPVQLKFGLDFSTFHESSDKKNFWECPKIGMEDDMPCILGQTVNTRKFVFSGFKLKGSARFKQETYTEEKSIGTLVNLDVTGGRKYVFDKLVINEAGFDSGCGPDQAWATGLAALNKIRNSSFDELQAAHSKYWENLWNTLDVTIEGDPENQQGIRYCIYQLHQTYHGSNPQANIGAKGLTGEFYNGHTFWDTEAYCLNFYLFNNPQAAKNLLLYRYHHLPQAEARAKEIDCQGACFPFATINGEEDCGLWWIANVEIHVGLAIFYALWHYARITGDQEFLYKEGAELLVQISRFYSSRGQWSQNTKDFGLYGVMGPDEFKLMANNNCYMNLLMKKLFAYTAGVIKEMAKSSPASLKALSAKLNLQPSETKDWLKQGAKTRILQDKKTGIFEQNDGFFDMPHMDLKSIPIEQFPLYHSWSYDRLYRYDMHKQPDVLLFLFFFNREFSPKEKKANYDYYEPRCIHESSLSPAIPKKWKSFAYRVLYRDAVLEVKTDNRQVFLKLIKGVSLPALVYGKKYMIDKTGIAVKVPAGKKG